MALPSVEFMMSTWRAGGQPGGAQQKGASAPSPPTKMRSRPGSLVVRREDLAVPAPTRQPAHPRVPHRPPKGLACPMRAPQRKQQHSACLRAHTYPCLGAAQTAFRCLYKRRKTDSSHAHAHAHAVAGAPPHPSAHLPPHSAGLVSPAPCLAHGPGRMALICHTSVAAVVAALAVAQHSSVGKNV